MIQNPFINTYERLADLVKEAKDEQSLSTGALATKANVSISFIQDIEAARPRAELPNVLHVLQTLGMEPRALPVLPAYLFDESGSLLEGVEFTDNIDVTIDISSGNYKSSKELQKESKFSGRPIGRLKPSDRWW